MPRHICCACFTHNNLPCCNEGHVDHTGAQYVRKAWERSPLLRSVKANLATRVTPPVEHELTGTACTCGGWEAKLGESIHRAFDRHLLDVTPPGVGE